MPSVAYLLALSLTFAPSPGCAPRVSAGEVRNATADAVELRGALGEGGRRYVLRVATQPYTQELEPEFGELEILATTPLAVLSAFELEVDGEAWRIPRPAWREITNPAIDRVQIGHRDGSPEIDLLGGDGGEAYKCTLRFKDGRLFERLFEPSHGEPETKRYK